MNQPLKKAHHFTPTPTELVETIQFWRDYFNRGGTGEQPSPFQLDVLNHEDLRDAFLFWQVGGSPHIKDERIPPGVVTAYELLGPVPTNGEKTCKALDKIMEDLDTSRDSTDTGIVFCLAAILNFLRSGHYDIAEELLLDITKLGIAAAKNGVAIAHLEPIKTLAILIEILKTVQDPKVKHSAVLTMIGLEDEAKGVVDGEV